MSNHDFAGWLRGEPARRRPRRRPRPLANIRLAMEGLESRRLLGAEPLLITEFMASNGSTLRDRFRHYSDWVELHNPTDQAVELDGWHLSDDWADVAKWRFPAVTVPAGGYLVVHASGQDRAEANAELPRISSLEPLVVSLGELFKPI